MRFPWGRLFRLVGSGAAGLRGGAPVVLLGVLLAMLPAPPGQAAENIRARQWHLDALKISEVQRITTGRGVVVAVIDSGVQANHPDLAGQVLPGLDATGSGTEGRVDGANHGTGVAGLIAARGGGPDRALGVAPGAKILPIRISHGVVPNAAPEAIRWAADHGAKVINMSFGSEGATDEEIEAVRYAQDRDVVLVAAAGNVSGGSAGVEAPARIPGVLAVSATDRTGKFWSGGVRGPQIAIAAPGVDMQTLASRYASGRPGGYIRVPAGTSAAAPLVAGAAALVRARYPDASAAEVINRLIRTADDAGPEGRDDAYGFGRLNLLRALTEDVPSVAANPLLPSVSATGERTAASSNAKGISGLLVAVLAGAALLVFAVVLVVVLVVVRANRGRARRPGGW